MATRAFRFGVQVSRGRSAEHWSKVARYAEAMGYSAFHMPDHFWDQLAPVPALMAAAAVTKTMRIGSLVFCNDYKHPAVLAKEAATMDVLSNGRLELGLGAGWTRADYESVGLPFDSPGVRIERLQESLNVIRGLLADGPFSFAGKHYRIHHLDSTPKPIQRPHPPLSIGGGGRRILSLAAREADIVGINIDLRSGSLETADRTNSGDEATRQKIDWVREAAGERFEHIELQISCYKVIVKDRKAEALDQAAQEFGVPREVADQVPHILAGSPADMVATLQERRDRYGFSYIVVAGESMRGFAPVVEKLAGR